VFGAFVAVAYGFVVLAVLGHMSVHLVAIGVRQAHEPNFGCLIEYAIPKTRQQWRKM